jgi:hypothetical protein
MKRYLLFLLFSFQMILFAQKPTLEWVKTYGAANESDRPEHVDTDAEGYVYYGASMATNDGIGKVRIAKYNSAGALIWSVIYTPDFAYHSLELKAMDVDPAGNICVLYQVENKNLGFDGGQVIILEKYNSSGTKLWSVTETSGSIEFRSQAMTVDEPGNVYVCASMKAISGGPTDYIVFKYNKFGSKSWGAFYNGPANNWDNPSSIAVDNSGNVFVTGIAHHLEGRPEKSVMKVTTIKYSSGGYFQWQKNFPVNGVEEGPTEIKLTPSGNNVYVLSTACPPSYEPIHTLVKYNASGVVQWTKTLTGKTYNKPAWFIDVAGNCYLSIVEPGSVALNYDMATYKFTTAGVQQWKVSYNGGDSTVDVPGHMAMDASQGNLYITGSTITWTDLDNYYLISGKYRINTVRYTSTGTLMWAVNYKGPATQPYAAGRFITLYGSGFNPHMVYVAGGTLSSDNSSLPNSSDLLLLKYNPIMSLPSTLETPALVSGYKLNAAPNPFAGSTTIRFEIPYDAQVSLKIYDALGREVRTLVNGLRSAGVYQSVFNAGRLPSQQYFYTLKLISAKGEFKETKVVLLK